MRQFLRAAAVAATVALVAVPTGAYALVAAPNPPAQRALSAEVVAVGKVTAVGKDDVEVLAPYPGAKNKMKYRVATVKVTDGLAGAEKLKEIKIGFIPPAKPNPNPKGGVGIRPIPPRGGFGMPELKEGQEMLFFLSKHPNGDFYIMPGMNMPVDVTTEQGKKELESVKKVVAVLADPTKALKSDKPEARAEAAAVMVMKYRAYPAFGGEVENVAINADESKLILKALAEGDWSGRNLRFDGPPNPMQAFYQLGLTVKDGWVQPQIAPQPPGAPPIDFNAVMKDAYIKWLDGPGKNYVVKKVAPKAKPSEK